jgi:HEAT repeat protein
MITDRPLTIDLLTQSSDRELQHKYLNDLSLTPQIGSLLGTIEDRNLATRLVDLAFGVDLRLGARLSGQMRSEFQLMVGEKIDRLRITNALKIDLWGETKSRSALPYLERLFIDKDRIFDLDYGNLMAAIIKIDRDLAIALLIQDIESRQDTYPQSADILSTLAAIESIECLGNLLQDRELIHDYSYDFAIQGLAKIGTQAAIDRIRDALYAQQGNWSCHHWIVGLGIVAEPEMVEYLIYLLYLPTEYLELDLELNEYDDFQVGELQCRAIDALAIVGGNRVFEILSRSLYWLPDIDYPNPAAKTIQALFKLDRERMLTSLKLALESGDTRMKKCAAAALTSWDISIDDRHLSILMDAIDEPDLDVKLTIVESIRNIIDRSCHFDLNIDGKLIARAIDLTRIIIFDLVTNPELVIRHRAICQLSPNYPIERDWMMRSLGTLDFPTFHLLQDRIATHIDRSHLQIISTYFKCDAIDLRVFATENIGSITGDGLLPKLISLLKDPADRIRAAVVKSIIDLDTPATLPIILEIAGNPDLVITLVMSLDRCISGTNKASRILNRLQQHRSPAIEIIDRAEQTLIALISENPDLLSLIIRSLGAIGGDRSVLILQQILEDEYCDYSDMDDAIVAIARINTELARSVLLGFLPDDTNIGGWIYTQFHQIGIPENIPHLWAAQAQSDYLYLEAIIAIQERYNLYNPDFSNGTIDQLRLIDSPQLRNLILNGLG